MSMDIKRMIGMLLLFVMLVTAYAFFGVGTITPKEEINKPVNYSATPEISIGSGFTVQEQATVDFSSIAVMGILILFTSAGSLRVKSETEEIEDENDAPE